MKIILTKDYDEMSKKAADLIIEAINEKSDLRLGLATGSTPLLTYKKIIERYKEEKLDFSKIITFNLDEYAGLNAENKQSYHYYMRSNFFDFVNVKKENIHIPDGDAKDFKDQCDVYEKEIEEAQGIDLQILGIGRNAHIGFNEPQDVFSARTHIVNLKSSTIKANARFFENEDEVPDRAISMGIATIMKAKKIILLANGKEKAEAVRKALTLDIDPKVPASILQLHKDTTFILDKEAASELAKSFLEENLVK